MSVEERIRRLAGRAGQTAQESETRGCAAQTPGRRSLPRKEPIEGGGGGKLLSPARRREAVRHVQERLRGVRTPGVSRGGAMCRATQQYRRTQATDEDALRDRIIVLAREYGRYGYRSITALLQHEGWRVNHKRVERMWRQEGLKVPHKQAKRATLGGGWVTSSPAAGVSESRLGLLCGEGAHAGGGAR